MKTVINLSILAVVISVISVFIGQIQKFDDGELATGQSPLTAHSAGTTLNTTVIILNWSRLSNVKKIVSEICSTLLDDTVHSIIIWNNNPKPLLAEDFSSTLCPASRLQPINSAENLYFQARYMACAQATTPYCFIQDDDFLVRPEIIKSISTRMDDASLSSIHLQPADEMLSSQLRTIIIAKNTHATFAWLGYGTIIKRSRAIDFLALLDGLDLSDDEHKMADNYFTILSNEMPEIWFDAGIPLGGGQPFTVGTEGEERNNRHIIRATELLESISRMDEATKRGLPYITFADQSITIPQISRAPCHGRVCVFATSIQMFPENIIDNEISSDVTATQILELEKHRLKKLGEEIVSIYLGFPPSNAVDGVSETAFRSSGNAKKYDWIMLDLARSVYYDVVQFALLVPEAVGVILRSSTFETSQDGKKWDIHDEQLLCSNGFESRDPTLRTCKFTARDVYGRYFRVRLHADVKQNWIIHELYLA